MNQFLNILSFEFKGIVKNKAYIGITIGISAIIAIALTFPTIMTLFQNNDFSETNDGANNKEKSSIIVVVDNLGIYPEIDIFQQYAPQYKFVSVNESEEEIRNKIDAEEYEGAIIITDPMNAKYLVKTMYMDSYFQNTLSDIMKQNYLKNILVKSGITEDEAALTVASQANVEVIETGKSFLSLYIYTYILLFLIYLSIVLYGQMVSTSVVTEKSSRAMELLITTAKPTNLMFGKVIGVGLAGISQLATFLLTTVIFYNINKASLNKIPMLAEIFTIPALTTVYMVVFFILGFFLYAFMFGALGSTVSRMEELSTSSTPLMMLFVAAFVMSMVTLTTGESNMAITVLSFVPFFTPMLMFVRICMTTVPTWQVLLSIAILFASNIGIGYISAKIYRIGVLMYGNPPKIKEILKFVKQK